jgi:predicted protein tyrosine phosphatase
MASHWREARSNNVRPHTNCYWVEPGRLLAGEYPGAFDATAAREKLGRHLDAGLTFFLDLTDPEDGLLSYAELLQAEAAARGLSVQHQQLTIRDMDVPSREQMTAILDALDAAHAAGHNVYVHCWGGIGRTGTVVGCYLVRHGLTGEQALAQIARWWRTVAKSDWHPRSPQTDEQVEFVMNWREVAS